MKKLVRCKPLLFVAVCVALQLAASFAFAAAAPTRVSIHVPSKSLSIMPYYFGIDKGFFAREQIEPQLIVMAPPTALWRWSPASSTSPRL